MVLLDRLCLKTAGEGQAKPLGRAVAAVREGRVAEGRTPEPHTPAKRGYVLLGTPDVRSTRYARASAKWHSHFAG